MYQPEVSGMSSRPSKEPTYRIRNEEKLERLASGSSKLQETAQEIHLQLLIAVWLSFPAPRIRIHRLATGIYARFSGSSRLRHRARQAPIRVSER